MKDGRYGKGRVMHPGSCIVHNKETCLLIAQIVEICAGRIEEAASMINNTEGSWFIQLASSICDSLHAKMLLSQVTLIHYIVCWLEFYSDTSVILQ